MLIAFLNLAWETSRLNQYNDLTRGEDLALNVGYVTNLFYDLLPPAPSLRFENCSLPFRLIFSTCSCGDQFLGAIADGKIALGFVGLHEPIEMRGLQFGTIASYKTVVALPKMTLWRGVQVRCESERPRAEVFIGMSEASYPSY